MEPDPTARVRALCLAFPEVTERLSHGEPAETADQSRADSGLRSPEHEHPAGEGQRLVDRCEPLVLHRLPNLQLSIRPTNHAATGNAAMDMNIEGSMNI